MPYRAMLWSIVTVALALLAVGLWISAVEPRLAETVASTQIAPPVHPSTRPGEDVSIKMLIRGTMFLAFILICMLLLIGIFATSREWFRYRTLPRPTKKIKKTAYIDAWKIAGERLNPAKDSGGDPDAPDEDAGEELQ